MKRGRKKNPVLSEHDCMVTYFDWVTKMENADVRFKNIFAVVNEAKRSYALANYLRAAGIHSGVPDIIIAWPSYNNQYAAAFLEVKRSDGGAGLSPNQILWREQILSAKVYLHRVCLGIDGLLTTTREYFGI